MRNLMRPLIAYWLIACSMPVLLTGCGFQPRGQLAELAALPAPVHIEGLNRFSDLYRELAGQLQAAGIATTLERPGSATVVRVLEHRTETRVLTVDSRNRQVENEIEESARFDLLDGSGETLAAPQTVRVLRIQYRPPEEVLASRREGDRLREDMRAELAQRILQRIAAQR